VQTLDEYVMIDARYCEAYAGFSSRHEGGDLHVYVSRINFCIDADVNADTSLDAADSLLFGEWYLAGNQAADLTRNGAVDAADVQRFTESYACACSP
jgi:hypothetical protein